MKKISMVFLSLLISILVTGCGKAEEQEAKEQTLVCMST